MTSEVSSKFAMCRDDVPDKLKNKAKAATETSSKKFQYNFKKGDEVGGLWKNIAEIQSFLWVVLAFEKWVPKSEQRGDLWRHIMRGCIDVAWSLWRSIMQVALVVQQWRHNLHSWTGTCYNNKGACLRRIN